MREPRRSGAKRARLDATRARSRAGLLLSIPGERLAQTLREGVRRNPAELLAGAVTLDGSSAIVARPRRTEGHLDVADEIAHRLGELADRDRLGRLEVVRAVLRGRLEREHV